MFYPLFNPQVYVTDPNGNRTRVNPENCLYPNSAFELSLLLGQHGCPCVVVAGPALGNFSDVFKGGYEISESVPWLQFKGASGNDVYERAGSLGAFWLRATNEDTHQVDDKTALRNCLADVKNVIAGN